MKIYDFTEVNQRKQSWGQHIRPIGGRKDFLPVASGGEDMVQISEAALSRHRKSQVIAMERARIEKTAQMLMPEIKSALGSRGTHRDLPAEPDKVQEIARTINSNDSIITNDDVIEETVDRLLGFFAG